MCGFCVFESKRTRNLNGQIHTYEFGMEPTYRYELDYRSIDGGPGEGKGAASAHVRPARATAAPCLY